VSFFSKAVLRAKTIKAVAECFLDSRRTAVLDQSACLFSLVSYLGTDTSLCLGKSVKTVAFIRKLLLCGGKNTCL